MITLPVSFERVAGREVVGVHSLLNDVLTKNVTYTTQEVEEDAEVLR